MPTVLQVHAEVGCVCVCMCSGFGGCVGIGGGYRGGGKAGWWGDEGGLLVRLRDVSLHFSHLEDRAKKRGMKRVESVKIRLE